VALGGADQTLAADVELDRRLADGLAVLALLDDDAEALQAEQRLMRRQLTAQQELERGVRRFVVVAAVLALLEAPEDGRHALVIGGRVHAQLAGLAEDGALAGELRDEDALFVTDQGGVDVLEGLRRLLHGGDVQPTLVGEGGPADVRRMRPHREVDDVGDEVGRLGEPRELLGRDDGEAHLQLQGRDDRDEVGVAAALAVSVERALDVPGAGLDGGETRGDGAVAVVVGVHADGDGDARDDVAHGVVHERGQRRPVGIAQTDDVRAGLGGGADAAQGVRGVVAVGVEEVLGVVDDALALRDEEAHRLVDHAQVLVAAHAQDLRQM